ncbi:hypothetical protein SH668x_002384 [Planctomicrobium sp. SH668]|uniref:alpha/beta hydrolase family protein n=1 Tax=Planctomicrobium sp. SH668 TaxID=3448126 RepID=UPI003F5AECBD
MFNLSFSFSSGVQWLHVAFCMLLLITQAAPAFSQHPPYDVYPEANPPYYRVRYEASEAPGELKYPVNYTVWIPEGVQKLRGVIVHQHGCGEGSCQSGLTGAYDLHWQALARKHDCALLAAAYEQRDNEECQNWCDPRNGSDAAFQRSLADLGKQSGHAELAEVPWAIWGHSGGGHWAGGMALLHPERVAAAWLRSGVPLLEGQSAQGAIQPHLIPDQVLSVPMMCNVGIQEGFESTTGPFARVWSANVEFFNILRPRGALVSVSLDPISSHDCGNQRYLAILWLDACLTARLPEQLGEPLKPMKDDQHLPVRLQKHTGIPESVRNNPSLTTCWLPNAEIADAWVKYNHDTKITDASPPKAPTNVKLVDHTLTWQAEADLESGLAGFLIERDGERIAHYPEAQQNPFGRKLFQNLTYSDTPTQPLKEMKFVDPNPVEGKEHTYRVISVNTVGLESEPSPETK